MFSLFFSFCCRGQFAPLLLLVLSLSDGLTAFQITGALGGVNSTTGARPLRYEIHDFANSGPAFDLFILALIDLQSVNQTEELSYFQVSGIHGFPRIPWDGVSGTGSYPGFCTHAATPFPTWHRPYVALFEQLIWQYAQGIASHYPDDQRDEYSSAALSLRVPYWDWAVYPALPDVVSEPQISINTPNGWQTVNNPLYTYVFQSDAAGNGFPLSDPMANFSETVRWWSPDTKSSNQSAATAALLANAPAIQALTYLMFTSVTNYTTFSCTWPGGQWLTANNIESIHNSIHNSIGGYGHMQFPEVAGFDPSFWLHHANVDRLFAMWQALYPDSYIQPTVNAYGSYYENVGFVDSGTTALAPFHSDDGSTLFTSDDVRSTRTFGYSYPELPDWEMSPDELANNPFIKWYNQQLNAKEQAKILEQWSISVLVDRFPLNTSFCIDFFMGDAPDEVSAWPAAPNLIGTYAQFNPANVTMLHPNGYPEGQVRGEISMTHTLAAAQLSTLPAKMRLSGKLLLLSASLITHALAQARIAFTSVPALVVAGQSYNISWAGGDGSPVTITLREGDPNDLKTIATLADGVTEDFFVWDVSKSLATASDYALQITQGQDSINYSGLFSIADGSGTSTISYSGLSTTTGATNATTSVISTTSTAIASLGKSTIIPSNTTFSSATLSATTSTSFIPAVTQHMTSTSASSSSESPPSSTSAAPTAAATTSVPDAGAAGQLGSSAALVLGTSSSAHADVNVTSTMPEVNGVLKEQNQPDGGRSASGRVSSASMMRSVLSSSDSSPSESVPWSSAIGHAGTGKSGRVIERLQGDIDRLRREKQLLKTRLEEAEKENETLKTRNQSLQDRTSNYEQSHEASLRQLTRRERQVEELREELRKEKLKTAAAEAQAVAATSNEEIWRDQASQAKSLAVQKEVEYETVVACRKVDYDRHQSGLEKIKGSFDALLRRQQDDLEKQKKLEIIAEQQRQTIAQLEELTKRLTSNFKAYRNEVDAAISDLRQAANNNDQALTQKLDEMAEVTGRMRWVMKLEDIVNHNHHDPVQGQAQHSRRDHVSRPPSAHEEPLKRSRSPTKNVLTKHRRKDSAKASR
ncbi:hypothetical protein AYL99_02787 [Fonsecaea erecta]|uniref:tyrosinase n=1 Tax=Fonsecaea erecta TaxID=1367422 RepID=A0A178ZUW8_9EURO|nr:hypothetical protein AYL99_02787 [Fonsecaea erecta]OAP63560.1 hypothetical protein AYL99_02787 [Fonsecaea erecta]